MVTVPPRRAMIVGMESLNLADTFVLFLALLGPQKVLLSVARLTRTLDARSIRVVVAIAAVAAACVGVVCSLTAPWLATFFHIGTAAIQLSSGLLFFGYALGVVLGVHFDLSDDVPVPGADGGADADGDAGDEADPLHPLTSGLRELLLPFMVSPLAVAAALQESLTVHTWHDRWIEAAAFALVALVDLLAAWLFAPLLGRAHEIVLELLSRLLGILLAAVGVQLFLLGLTTLGVLHS
jgi:multiple antibiotic resistance protein